jgi:hypothetical protein
MLVRRATTMRPLRNAAAIEEHLGISVAAFLGQVC